MVSLTNRKGREMTDMAAAPGPGGEPSATRVFELVDGMEYVVFFAAEKDELPSDAVRRELRVLARRSQNAPTRSVVGAIAGDVTAGVVGGMAWEAVSAALVATTAYLRQKARKPAVDAATISIRLKAACEQILKASPGEMTNLHIERIDDGRWQAEFTCAGRAIQAMLDPSGSVVAWVQELSGAC
jgi:hypothetical protein